MTKFKDIFHESNELADKAWGIIRFWSLFDQTIVGKELAKCLDNISINLSLLIAEDKKNRQILIKKIHNLVIKAAIYNDIGRRRKLIKNPDYQDIYKRLNKIKKLISNF